MPLDDKCAPVILSELSASLGMVSRARGSGPWEPDLLNLWLPEEIVKLHPEDELRAINCIFSYLKAIC